MKISVPTFVTDHLHNLLFLPPVVVGAAVLVMLVQNRQPPEREPEREVARVLRVIRAMRQPIVPRAIGYGTAEPGNVWQAVVFWRAPKVLPAQKQQHGAEKWQHEK